jgi:hypothetical protein
LVAPTEGGASAQFTFANHSTLREVPWIHTRGVTISGEADLDVFAGFGKHGLEGRRELASQFGARAVDDSVIVETIARPAFEHWDTPDTLAEPCRCLAKHGSIQLVEEMPYTNVH